MSGMRTFRPWIVSAAVAVSFANSTLPGVAFADPPGPAPGSADHPGEPRGSAPPPFEALLERHADRLGLGEQTRSEIRTIAVAARGEARALEKRLHDLHGELRALLDQDAPDLEAALAQAERIGSAETDLHKLRLRTMLRIRELLTPEQRRELVRIHEERRSRRHRGPTGDGW